MLHQPQDTQFVHRDTLELTEGVNALYHWLRDVENPPTNWEFKLEPRIREYDPMIFKCIHSYNHGSSFEVVFRIDSADGCQFANVVNIYPKYDIPFDNETYNRFLAQFVNDVIKPYTKASNITYRYTGDLRTIQDVGDLPGKPKVTQAGPEKPEEEPAFVTRDCLEITEGAEEFFKWLHGKSYNGEKIGVWSFKAVPGTQDEDFIVCHKPNTTTSPSDVHIAFRNHFTYARVCGIVVNDHYTPDDVGFNFILSEFVRDIMSPHADYHKITYNYAGTPNEQPLKSNGIIEDTPETPKEEPGKSGRRASFIIPDNAKGFYYFLLTKAAYYDNGGKWGVTRRDTLFDCRCTDLDTKDNFTVTISFTIDSSFARVTDIQADGESFSVDKYNYYLCRFVDEMVKPFAEIAHFRYDFFIDSNKSKGTDIKVNTETLDTLKFTEGTAGFYGLLLTKEHFKDTSNWSVSRCLDHQFKCDFDDLTGGEESFSVYVQFKSYASYGVVTTVGATGNLSPEQYNRHLKRFVDEMVKPYAEIQHLKYEYSGKC